MGEQQATSLYKAFRYMIEADVAEIFGPTGAGKSLLMEALVQDALEQKVEIAFLDTEHNYTQNTMDWLQKNTKYNYVAAFDEVVKWVDNIISPKAPKVKLILIDSLGAPALGEWSVSTLKRRGDILLRGTSILYNLKTYCQRNDAMAIVTNQPVSEMQAKKDMYTGELLELLNPFGGKWAHFVKEVYRCEKESSTGLETKILLTVFKSRHMAAGREIATMTITTGATNIHFKPYAGRKDTARPPIRITTDKVRSKDKSPNKKDNPPSEEEKPETGKLEEGSKSTSKNKKPEGMSADLGVANTAGKRDSKLALQKQAASAELESTKAAIHALAEGASMDAGKLASFIFQELGVPSVEELTSENADKALELVKNYIQKKGGDFFDKT